MMLKCRLCKYHSFCQPVMEHTYKENKQEERIRRKLKRTQRLHKFLTYLRKLLTLDDNN